VAAERGDPRSILNLYRQLARLRRSRPALLAGAYRPVAGAEPGASILAYLREAGADRVLVLLNVSSEERSFDLGAGLGAAQAPHVILTSGAERPDPTGRALTLAPFEATILDLRP
jgi:alpha-glucosidase